MKKQFLILVLVGSVIFMLSTAFQDAETNSTETPVLKKEALNQQKQTIRSRVQEKMDLYLKQKEAECIQSIYEKASLKVDSILMDQAAILLKTDSIQNTPERPIKPIKPNRISPKEGLDNKPILSRDSLD